MADITLRTETSGIRPMFDHVVTSKRRALQTPGSFRQIREVNERELRTHRLVWQGAREGQKYLLEDAWSTSKGGVLLMDYTPLGDVDANAVEVRFVEGTLRTLRTGLATWDMEVEVEEAHA